MYVCDNLQLKYIYLIYVQMLTFEDIDIMTFGLRNFPQCEEGLVSFLFTWDCSQKSQAQIRLQINMGWTIRTELEVITFFQLSQETF